MGDINFDPNFENEVKCFWHEPFQKGFSLDQVIENYQNILPKLNNPTSSSNTNSNTNKPPSFSWPVVFLSQAIEAKKNYYTSSLIGKISKIFQLFVKKFFSSQTPLEKAEDLLKQFKAQLGNTPLNIVTPIKLKHYTFLEAISFGAREYNNLLNESKTKNKARLLSLTTPNGLSQTDFIYAFPDGNCYLISKTPENLLRKKQNIQAYQAYDFKNHKNVAFITSDNHDAQAFAKLSILEQAIYSTDNENPQQKTNALLEKALAAYKPLNKDSQEKTTSYQQFINCFVNLSDWEKIIEKPLEDSQ